MSLYDINITFIFPHHYTLIYLLSLYLTTPLIIINKDIFNKDILVNNTNFILKSTHLIIFLRTTAHSSSVLRDGGSTFFFFWIVNSTWKTDFNLMDFMAIWRIYRIDLVIYYVLQKRKEDRVPWNQWKNLEQEKTFGITLRVWFHHKIKKEQYIVMILKPVFLFLLGK